MTNKSWSWKFIFGGAGGAGKTTLLHRYLHNEFLDDTKMTMGVQFNSMEMERNGYAIGLMLWDLGGQDKFRFIQNIYVEGARAGFIFFDMSRLSTIGQVDEWVDLFKKNASPGMPIMLVGTKLDLVPQDQQATIHETGEGLVRELGLTAYTATSAKMNWNVSEIITYMVDLLIYKTIAKGAT